MTTPDGLIEQVAAVAESVPVPGTEQAGREERLLERLVERLSNLGMLQGAGAATPQQPTRPSQPPPPPPIVLSPPQQQQADEETRSWSSSTWQHQGWHGWSSWSNWKTMGGMKTKQTAHTSPILIFRNSMAERKSSPITSTM